MNSASLLVLVRYAISAAGTFLVARGYFDQGTFNTLADQLLQLLGLVMTIAPAVYGALQKRTAKQIAVTSALDEVTKPVAVASPALAEAVKKIDPAAAVVVAPPS